MKKLFIWGLAALFSIAAQARAPDLVSSQYLVTVDSVFTLTGGEGAAYEMKFALHRPFDQPVFVTVDFEDPADAQTPLFLELELPAGETRIDVKSPYFRAVRNGENYLTKVWLYEDATRKQLIGTHEQQVRFKMPRDLLKLLGVTPL